jgi:antitoxin component of MazEF toxin-antitoxin module
MGHRVQFNPEEKTVTGARTLRISGGSTVLTIPPEMLDVLDWEDGDDLTLKADYEEGSLVIEATE